MLVVKLAEEKAVLVRQVAERDATIASLRATLATLEGTIAVLQSSLVNHANDLELMRRRLYGVKSERGGTSELQMLLGKFLDDKTELTAALEKLVEETAAAGDAVAGEPVADSDAAPPAPPPVEPPAPKGRRDLWNSKLPIVPLRIVDAELAAKGRLIGWDETRQLIRTRAEVKILQMLIAQYEITVAEEKTVLVAEWPKTLFPRSLLHGSFIAWLAVQKFLLGVPHYRLEQHLEATGAPLDRGTMCRKMEGLGTALQGTVVKAMLHDAKTTCGVLSTDATGAAIQPGPRNGGPKRPCKKGHFFTIVADCDHVLFHYTEKHSQDAVASLFEGFSGYLQADASSVYHLLEHGPPEDTEDAKGEVFLVGCWAHLRRYYFEAAVCKYLVGLRGLQKIREIYKADNKLKKLSPAARKRDRERLVVPLVDAFFAWVRESARTTPGPNLATKALGYARNQEAELRRVFLDGRIPLDNTRSERALKIIVVGRKNWMFYGSDIHATAAAAIFSVLASCRLHRIEPQRYLEELLRVLPYWPDDRYLELAPKYWVATRARLAPSELEALAGIVTVPPVLGSAPPPLPAEAASGLRGIRRCDRPADERRNHPIEAAA